MQNQYCASSAALSDEMTSVEKFLNETRTMSPAQEEASSSEFTERRKIVRRRADRLQGKSLEKLGHAVEYLMDSRQFQLDPATAKAERDALQILMRSSRAVFAECAEIVPVWERISKHWRRPLRRRPATAKVSEPQRSVVG